jgi:hypothetical protein
MSEARFRTLRKRLAGHRIARFILGICIAALLGAAIGTAMIRKLSRVDALIAASGEMYGRSFPEDALRPPDRRFVAFADPGRAAVTAIEPASVRRLGDRHFVADFGTSWFAALRITLRAGERRSVHVVLAERLGRDGRSAFFDPAAQPAQPRLSTYARRLTLTPGQTLVIGGPRRRTPGPDRLPRGISAVAPFRFVEVAGAAPDEVEIRQLAVHHPFDDSASDFTSSDPALDRVWRLSKHTIQATSFAEVYVDGNRERRAYEADSYIADLGHLNLDLDRRLGRRTLEFLLYNPTWPTEWLMMPIFMARQDYLYTGDREFLGRIYPRLRERTLLELARSDGLVTTRSPAAQQLAERLGLATAPRDIVDWPPSERDGYATERVALGQFVRLSGRAATDRLMASAAELLGYPNAAIYYVDAADGARNERWRIVAVNTVVNAYHHRALLDLAGLAEALGFHREAALYTQRAARVRRAAQLTLFDRATGLFRDGEGSSHYSMHANLFALAFGLAEGIDPGPIVAHLRNGGMAVSVYGAQFLLDTLYMHDEAAPALALLTSTSRRGWLAMQAIDGSSMTTEAWSVAIKSNEDWNHVWGASPANLIPRWLMGIRPTQPGFSRFTIQPRPGPLRSARLRMPTVKGPIEIVFASRPGQFRAEIAIPRDAVADILAPANGNAAFVDGARVEACRLGEHLYLGGLRGPRHLIETHTIAGTAAQRCETAEQQRLRP